MLKEYYKIVFLILHYYTIDDTIKCVTSIKERIDTNNYEIVIVDNGSPNGSGQELKKKYEKDENIHILINDKNLGFANGNNLGFQYAKKQLKADFIVMLNNDTYLIQNDFCKVIMDEYSESEFGVMGPKIILRGNKVNGIYKKLPTVKEQKIRMLRIKVLHILSIFNLNNIYLKLKKKIREIIKGEIKENDYNIYETRFENIILHGCCLVFSPQYIKLFDGLDNRTFLYCEEELLFIRLINNKLKTIYNPKLLIFHNEDSATDALTKTKRKKEKFVYKNLIRSNKILLNELKNTIGEDDEKN